MTAANEACPVGLVLEISDALPLYHSQVGRPDFRLPGRPAPPRGKKSADIGDKFSLNKKFREDRVCRIGSGLCQYHFCV